MQKSIRQIQEALNSYSIALSGEELQSRIDVIKKAQEYFPLDKQRALAIKLMLDWEAHPQRKIITASSEICYVKGGPCVTSFGILSRDWPGLSHACLGVLHEMGWNVYFMKGFSLTHLDTPLGIVILGVRTDDEKVYRQLIGQTSEIEEKLRQAAVQDGGKAVLLNEEIRKLEIYSRVIQEIQRIYLDDDIQEIIGLDGETVKFFAARSRDYLENRRVEDLSRQIVLNFSFIKKARETGSVIQLDITNFETRKEGFFTGVTVCGVSSMLNLEDCLKTIELTIPHYLLKHNREFTTAEGISLYRIEFVAANGGPLCELDQNRLREAFRSLVLEKRRDRAQWIESIGGFEQYARAIIPLLVREAQSTGITQVYQSVGNMTDLFIDFKIIGVIPDKQGFQKNTINELINAIESVRGLHIQNIKPPKRFGKTHLFIMDTRASLAVIDNVEAVYRLLHEKIRENLGDFRDFDEGMRTMDGVKFKSVYAQVKQMDKSLFREIFYSIEDFLRVSAPVNEIAGHIRLVYEILTKMKENGGILVQTSSVGILAPSGKFRCQAMLIGIAYPHDRVSLREVLAVFDDFDVTMSRLERGGMDILVCRVTDHDRTPSESQVRELTDSLKHLAG
ncbi:MAG TPA: hypothetical protein ENN17_02085 [bacterium]|nr:hypothetical protein [bacterium]